MAIVLREGALSTACLHPLVMCLFSWGGKLFDPRAAVAVSPVYSCGKPTPENQCNRWIEDILRDHSVKKCGKDGKHDQDHNSFDEILDGKYEVENERNRCPDYDLENGQMMVRRLPVCDRDG